MGDKSKTKYSTVLLVDDNEVDNLINTKMIENNNFAERIFVNTNSIGALEYLKNLDGDKQLIMDLVPDILFLDINMPIMDGFQFLEEFEKIGDKIKQHCKIVMLTTSLNPSDEEYSNKNKFVVKYIRKPLTDMHLQEL